MPPEVEDLTVLRSVCHRSFDTTEAERLYESELLHEGAKEATRGDVVEAVCVFVGEGVGMVTTQVYVVVEEAEAPNEE